jgi:hypothetical protein
MHNFGFQEYMNNIEDFPLFQKTFQLMPMKSVHTSAAFILILQWAVKH